MKLHAHEQLESHKSHLKSSFKAIIFIFVKFSIVFEKGIFVVHALIIIPIIFSTFVSIGKVHVLQSQLHRSSLTVLAAELIR